jgi:hypothetical protein
LRQIFRAFLTEERINRHFAEPSEGTTATGLLDWHQTEVSGWKPDVETIIFFWSAFEAARRLKIELEPVGRNWDQSRFRILLQLPVMTFPPKMFSNISRSKATDANGGKNYTRRIQMRKFNIVVDNIYIPFKKIRSPIASYFAAGFLQTMAK